MEDREAVLAANRKEIGQVVAEIQKCDSTQMYKLVEHLLALLDKEKALRHPLAKAAAVENSENLADRRKTET